MDVDHSVRSFAVRTDTFELPHGGRYTPDFRVRCAPGVLAYWGVKAGRMCASDPMSSDLVTEIRTAARSYGASFMVVPDSYFRDPVRLANAELLRHAARRKLPVGRERALAMLRDQGGAMLLVDLVRALGMGHAGRFAVLGLAALGLLQVDLSEPLGPVATVRMSGGGA